MRIFLAGATGALGKRLVPRIVADGHHVVAATRNSGKADALRAAGAEPIILDALDREAVMHAVGAARPEVIIHQLTALANLKNFDKFDDEFAMTNRLRTGGLDHLLAAARAVGARRFIAQSYAGWPYAREGGRVKTEDDPLDPDPPKAMRRTMAAIQYLEAAVSGYADLTSGADRTGIVLRYGGFYGPGTSVAADGDIVTMLRQRKFPIVGGGTGVWSFVHIDDAAEATRLAVTQGASGIYNVVDDEPAEVAEWLPALAKAVGAKPPYRLPAWIARLLVGDVTMSIMTRVRGASNARAKRTLQWRPAYASWRDGFVSGLNDESQTS